MTTDDLRDFKALHERAAKSASETRSTIVTLATASIGGLFFLASQEIKPSLLEIEKIFLLATLVTMVGSLSHAVWFGFCDAQWSYWWGVELDPARSPQQQSAAKEQKSQWHRRKSSSERLMLVMFVAAAIVGAVFVILRIVR